MDMLGQHLAVRDMVGLFFALGASEDTDQQIGKREEQPIEQLLLEILEIADEQCCPFLRKCNTLSALWPCFCPVTVPIRNGTSNIVTIFYSRSRHSGA